MDSLLEKEFHEPYHRWKKDPSPPNAGEFLRAVDPVLSSALRTYGGTRPSPVLKSHAKLMALEAAKRYDPARAKLRTHLMVQLQGLRRLHAGEESTIKLPERVGLDLHKIRLSTAELADRLGRDPSDSELADHAGISLKRLAHVRKFQPAYAEGQMMSQNEEGETAFDPAVVNADSDDAWTRFVYHDQDPVNQLIMEHTLGLHGKSVLPKKAIAMKLGISPGALSQRAAKIQASLDKRELTEGFF